MLGLGVGGGTKADVDAETTRFVLCGAVVVATGLPAAQCVHAPGPATPPPNRCRVPRKAMQMRVITTQTTIQSL